MLTQLREIVEKVAASTSLNEALELLVNEICLALQTEVCSVYLADNERQCYYLMATRGLKKPRGRVVTLAFNEGVVGLVGRLAEPLNLADVQSHPNFKLLPQVNEELFKSFLGVPIIYRRQRFGVLVIQQREHRQFDESEESFLVTLATQLASILAQAHLHGLFSQFRQTRLTALAASPGVAIAEGWVDSDQPSLDAVSQASALNIDEEQDRMTLALEEATLECRRFSKRFNTSGQKESAAVFDFYAHLLNDTQLRHELTVELEQGAVAEWAVKVVFERFVEQFARLSDPYLRERAVDMR
ncbi:MAG: phosphoenolpyruvate-utilizing N-terminal domain-containing protein, partial [Enterobacteriaceae bacterium]